jgi:DNA-binding MarR family transcriptional regulator
MIFSKKSHITETQVMDFFKSLMEASHAVHIFVEKVFFAQSDITMLQFGIIKQLIAKWGTVDTMTDLWCDQHTTRGNLSGMIDRMIDAGLVSRKEDTADRRKKQISLTKLWQKKHDEIETLMRKHIPGFIDQIKDIPLVELTSSLQMIRDVHIHALK